MLQREGHRAIDAERFVNAKAESYWGRREWMELGQVCRLNDLETEAQLSAILYRWRLRHRRTQLLKCCAAEIGIAIFV